MIDNWTTGVVASAERVDEDGPGAVVGAPAVGVQPDRRRLDEISDLAGELAVTRGWVLDGEQLVGKVVEVMDRARRCHRGDRRCVYVPVGEHGQDRRGRGAAVPNARHASV